MNTKSMLKVVVATSLAFSAAFAAIVGLACEDDTSPPDEVAKLLEKAGELQSRGISAKDPDEQLKLYLSAVELAEEALRKAPENVDAHVAVIDALQFAGFASKDRKYFDRAVVIADQAIKLAPNKGSLYVSRGLSRLVPADPVQEEACLRTIAQCVEDYTKAIQVEPTLADAYRMRSDALSMLGDDEHRRAAVADLEAVARLDPDDKTIWYSLGVQCNFAHDWRRGEEFLTTAITKDPQAPYSYRWRAEARMHLGDFDGAEQDLAVVAKDDPIEAAETRIFTYLDLKDQEKALDLANRLVGEHPDNPEAYETRGRYHGCTQRWNDVISDYRRAMELGGSTDHLFYVSNALLKLGEYEAALREIDAALARELLSRYVLLLQRAEANQGLGRYEAGLSDLAALEPECPWSSTLHQRRGEILAASGDAEGALREFTRAIEMRSGFETEAESLVSRAKLYIQQQKTAEAKQDLERAVKISPENEDAKRLLESVSKGM